MAKCYHNNKQYLQEATDKAIEQVLDMMKHLNDDFEGKLHFKTKIYHMDIEINVDIGPFS